MLSLPQLCTITLVAKQQTTTNHNKPISNINEVAEFQRLCFVYRGCSSAVCDWFVTVCLGTNLSLIRVGEVVGAPAGALIGGFVGYISGRKVSETVYDVVTQKGMPIGGR